MRLPQAMRPTYCLYFALVCLCLEAVLTHGSSTPRLARPLLDVTTASLDATSGSPVSFTPSRLLAITPAVGLWEPISQAPASSARPSSPSSTPSSPSDRAPISQPLDSLILFNTHELFESSIMPTHVFSSSSANDVIITDVDMLPVEKDAQRKRPVAVRLSTADGRVLVSLGESLNHDVQAPALTAMIASPSPSLSSPSDSSSSDMQLTDIRSNKAVTSIWVKTGMDDAGAWARRFVHNLPRTSLDGTAADRRLSTPLTEVDWSNIFSEPYVKTLATMWLICFICAGVVLITWIILFSARACCNSCGKRWATLPYTPREIRCHLGFFLILTACLGVCCAYGWTANVIMSDHIDSSFVALDAGFDYVVQFSPLLSSLISTANRAITRGSAINATISSIPSDVQLQEAISCFRLSTPILQQTESVASTVVLMGKMVGRALSLNMTLPRLATVTTSLSDPSLSTQYTNLHNALASLNSTLTLTSTLTASNVANDINNINAGLVMPRQAVAEHNLRNRYTALNTTRSTLIMPSEALSLYESSFSTIQPLITALHNNLSLPITQQDQPAILSGLITLRSLTQALPSPTNIANALNTVLGPQQPYTSTQLATRAADLRESLQGISPTLTTIPNVAALLQTLTTLSSVETNATAAAPLHMAISPSFLLTSSTVSSAAELIDAFLHGADVAKAANPATIASALASTRDGIASLSCYTEVIPTLSQFQSNVAILPPVSARAVNGAAYVSAIVSNANDFKANSDAASAAIPTLKTSTDAHIHSNFSSAKASLLAVDGKLKVLTKRGLGSTFQSLLTTAMALTYAITQPTVSSFAQALRTLQTASTTISTGITATNAITSELTALTSSHPSLATSVYSPLFTLNSRLSSLTNPLNDAIQYLTDAPPHIYAATGLPDNTESALFSAMLALNNTANSLSSVYSMSPRLSSLISSSGTAVSASEAFTLSVAADLAIPTDASTFQQKIENILPLTSATSSLSLAVRDIISASTLTTLASDMAGISTLHLSLQQNLTNFYLDTNSTTSLPGISGYATYADSNGYLLAQTNNTNGYTIANSSTGGSSGDIVYPTGMPAVDIAELELQAVSELRSRVPTDLLNKLTNYTRDVSEQLTSRRSSVEATYSDYQSAKNTYKEQSAQWDGVRLLFQHLLLLLPFLFSFLAFVSGLAKWHRLAMVIGLLWFIVTILIFAFAAIELPISAVLADHCDDLSAQLAANLAPVVWSNETLSFFKLQQDIQLSTHVAYLLSCTGPLPELLERTANPSVLLADQGLNMTDVMHSLSTVPMLTLATPMAVHLTELLGAQGAAEQTMTQFRSRLLCSNTQPLYAQANEEVCYGVAPAISLGVIMLLCTGIGSVFGICCSIRSFKRFYEPWQMSASGVVNPEATQIVSVKDHFYGHRSPHAVTAIGGRSTLAVSPSSGGPMSPKARRSPNSGGGMNGGNSMSSVNSLHVRTSSNPTGMNPAVSPRASPYAGTQSVTGSIYGTNGGMRAVPPVPISTAMSLNGTSDGMSHEHGGIGGGNGKVLENRQLDVNLATPDEAHRHQQVWAWPEKKSKKKKKVISITVTGGNDAGGTSTGSSPAPSSSQPR